MHKGDTSYPDQSAALTNTSPLTMGTPLSIAAVVLADMTTAVQRLAAGFALHKLECCESPLYLKPAGVNRGTWTETALVIAWHWGLVSKWTRRCLRFSICIFVLLPYPH